MDDDVLELFENGICLKCGGDDVECLTDCTEHKCIECGYIIEEDYERLRVKREYHGGE